MCSAKSTKFTSFNQRALAMLVDALIDARDGVVTDRRCFQFPIPAHTPTQAPLTCRSIHSTVHVAVPFTDIDLNCACISIHCWRVKQWSRVRIQYSMSLSVMQYPRHSDEVSNVQSIVMTASYEKSGIRRRHHATDSASLHHPEYDFNDEAIPHGCSYWVQLVEQSMPA